jgi:DNA-binding response OmpR family regulator
MKILVVEDEAGLVHSIKTYLSAEGFVCEHAMSFADAEDKLVSHDYDLVILDITLPDGNGLELLHLIKQERTNTGILIVSAKNSLDDKLKGLDLGADDYMTKPFHLAELNSRINAIVRRRNFDGKPNVVFNEIEIHPHTNEVTVHGKKIDLTKKEYDLLLYLITNRNRVLTKTAIAEHLWGDYMDMADSYDFIYTHIKNLRKKLEENGALNYLKTVYGLGYKFTDS